MPGLTYVSTRKICERKNHTSQYVGTTSKVVRYKNHPLLVIHPGRVGNPSLHFFFVILSVTKDLCL